MKRLQYFSSLIQSPVPVFQKRNLIQQFSHDILKDSNMHEQLKQAFPKFKYYSAYVGFDPTAQSLHLGNLITIIAMIRLSLHGFKPIFLIGGATGMIGDPSGKQVERQMLSQQQVNANIEGIKFTLQKVSYNIYDYLTKYKEQFNLTYIPDKSELILINNNDFYKNMNVIDFIRDVGRYFRMGYLLSKETVANRMKQEDGLSYTEFTYTLLQAYDYEQLFLKNIGGSDQWGNIMSGHEFIRKKHKKEVFALTIPLILTPTGQKFGKSEGNALWIDLNKQKTYDLYQYLFNTPDSMVIQLLKMFTFHRDEVLAKIEQDHAKNPEKRIAQKLLAQSIIEMLSPQVKASQQDGSSELGSSTQVGKTAEKFFQTDFKTFKEKSVEEICAYFKDLQDQKIKVSRSFLAKSSLTLGDLLVELKIIKTKSEIRRNVESGGVYVNDYRITLEDTKDLNKFIKQHCLAERFIVLRLGKKKYFLLEVESVHEQEDPKKKLNN